MKTEAAGRAREEARRTDGKFGVQPRPESEVALAGGLVRSADHPAHDLEHLGIFTAVTPDGLLVAANSGNQAIPCPVCLGVRAKTATCEECVGRGVINNIPFCDREWDEVSPGIFLGGHDNQPGGGDAEPGDKFDVVISLYQRANRQQPAPGVEHLTHTMVDGGLDPVDYDTIHRFADRVVEASERGETVLVRCLAGMNRSGLVTGLALVKMGWKADDTFEHMRRIRSPYVLFNESFTDFIRAYEAERSAQGTG